MKVPKKGTANKYRYKYFLLYSTSLLLTQIETCYDVVRKCTHSTAASCKIQLNHTKRLRTKTCSKKQTVGGKNWRGIVRAGFPLVMINVFCLKNNVGYILLACAKHTVMSVGLLLLAGEDESLVGL